MIHVGDFGAMVAHLVSSEIIIRPFVGVEIDPHYAEIAEARIRTVQPGLPISGTTND